MWKHERSAVCERTLECFSPSPNNGVHCGVKMHYSTGDTIVAISTARGMAAIAMLRVSGPAAIRVVERFFFTPALKKADLASSPRTARFGVIAVDGNVIDEVVVTVFSMPHSYTGENVVEVACHGSLYIQQKILQLFLSAGARAAEPGEFTLRAFLAGRMDLAQAEAVADLIASSSSVSHQVAIKQMRGGFSEKIRLLRQNLIDFASLIELELDFSEEDVEFADRGELVALVDRILAVISQLITSFELGNVIKNGVPVAIVGKPNAGKSTLLNVLLQDERAIVSDIPGTTRDVIEDELVIEGVLFRLIDTAGLRTTNDVIEQIGVNKAYEAMRRSAIVIYLFDAHEYSAADVKEEIGALGGVIGTSRLLLVANKIDREDLGSLKDELSEFPGILFISAKERLNIGDLRDRLLQVFDSMAEGTGDTIVTNARHAHSLKQSREALEKTKEGIRNGLPGDLLALEIRQALADLGNITGEVTSEDLLGNIFSRFCIGK